MQVQLLDRPEGNVIARGSCPGGPDYEFVIAGGGRVFFRVVGGWEITRAGPDAESFRRIAAAWNRYETEVVDLPTEDAQLDRVAQLRQELESLGALPDTPPSDPEPLWVMLLFEAENGLG